MLRQCKRSLNEAGISLSDAAGEAISPQGLPLTQLDAETAAAPQREKIEKRWSLDKTEPAESATDKDLGVDDELLKRQSTPIVEEGEANLLRRA